MTDETEQQKSEVGSRLRQVLPQLAGMVIVGLVLWYLFTQVVEWDEVVSAMAGFSGRYWVIIAAVTIVRIAVEALLVVACTPGLSWRRGVPSYLAPAATASVIPGPSDLAARYAMFKSWGFTGPQTSASVLLVFLYTTFAKVALPVFALVVLLVFGRSNSQAITFGIVAAGVLVGAVALIALLLRSEQTARRIGHGAGTAAHRIARVFRIKAPDTLAADLGERAAHFRDQTSDVIRSRSHLAWPAAFGAQAALFFTLLVSVRGVGISSDQLDWIAVFAAFALVQLLTSVPITPSGLGVAEAAYVALLAAESTGGLVDQVAAAAIIYRVFSWLIIIPLGGLSWFWWSRTLSARRSRQDDSPPAG